MIKFFRKIRQNLLSEGKTGKYLKYAFGEIILVVIGILIALQLNNLNENKKNNVFEKEILSQIQENLISDKFVLKQIELNFIKAIVSSKKILNAEESENRPIDLVHKIVNRLRSSHFS